MVLGVRVGFGGREGALASALIISTTYPHQVQTFERQVIVKLDGYTIFSRYPMLDNMAAGGLLLWANSNDHNDAAPVLTYGLYCQLFWYDRIILILKLLFEI